MNIDNMMLAVQTLSSGVLSDTNPGDLETVKILKDVIKKNFEEMKVFIDKHNAEKQWDIDLCYVRDYITLAVQALSSGVLTYDNDNRPIITLLKEIIKNGYEFLSLSDQKNSDVVQVN